MAYSKKFVWACVAVAAILILSISLAATRSKRKDHAPASNGWHRSRDEDISIEHIAPSLGHPAVAKKLVELKDDIPDFEALCWSNSETWDFAPSMEVEIGRLSQKKETTCGDQNLQNYVHELLEGLDFPDFAAVYVLYRIFPLGRWLMDAKIFFDNQDSTEYIGAYGDKTQEVRKRFQDAKQFWSGTNTSDVLLLGVHGSLLRDHAAMVTLLVRLYGVQEDLAKDIMLIVKELIEGSNALDYDFPLWTLGSFSQSFYGEPYPEFGTIPDKICIGDGLMEYLEWSGQDEGTAALDVIVSHAVAQQVQYETFLGPDYPHSRETGMFKSLMADAMAAYYAKHPRGGANSDEDVTVVYEVAYDIDDCVFPAANHHGGPSQKIGAAMWGVEQAYQAMGTGEILSAPDFLIQYASVAYPLLMTDTDTADASDLEVS